MATETASKTGIEAANKPIHVDGKAELDNIVANNDVVLRPCQVECW